MSNEINKIKEIKKRINDQIDVELCLINDEYESEIDHDLRMYAAATALLEMATKHILTLKPSLRNPLVDSLRGALV